MTVGFADEKAFSSAEGALVEGAVCAVTGCWGFAGGGFGARYFDQTKNINIASRRNTTTLVCSDISLTAPYLDRWE